MKQKFIWGVALVLLASSLRAQQSQSNVLPTELAPNLLRWSSFKLRGYGAIHYYNNDFDTNPNQKNTIDPERLNLYLDYQFSPIISLKTEFEFEHGGTGTSLELETFEEGGEFEQEIATGGEVKLEQVYINFALKEYFNVKLGRFKLQFGLAQNLDTPDEYFTTYRPEMENQLLPLGWYETGIDIYGFLWNKRIRYHLAFVNGLDATGFNSQHFIRDGHQTRFELVNAENFAFATRWDYLFGTHKNTFVGFSSYFGNSRGNRPKNDMDVDAFMELWEVHLSYNEGNWRLATTALWGGLGNANAVSYFNASLSNKLGVKRTPVARSAVGIAAEVGYDVLPYFLKKKTLMSVYPFVRYDFYDTMFSVSDGVVDNPRWQRSVVTGGVNWFVHKGIILKAHYAHKTLGSKHIDPVTSVDMNRNQTDKVFSMGIGFTF